MSPQYSGTPTGSVTFKLGTTKLATVTMSGGVATYTTTTLAVGTPSITAVYSGDSNFAPSTSAPLSQVINKATTTTTLSSSLNPSTFGQSVTFTATVSPQYSGTPTGSVTLQTGDEDSGNSDIEQWGGDVYDLDFTHRLGHDYGSLQRIRVLQ